MNGWHSVARSHGDTNLLWALVPRYYKFESISLQQRVRQLAEDGAQPAIYYNRRATRWQPYVKGLTIIVNSSYNSWRMEDVWLDK